MHHAYVSLRVDDHALRSASLAYANPHNVVLVLRDGANAQLAVARSIEPLGYVLAVHPDEQVGTCEQRKADHAACYARYSSWAASWAPRVESADVTVGACEVRAAPVAVRVSNSEWPVWWVPLPHVGGLPRRYFDLSVAIDSRICAAVARSTP